MFNFCNARLVPRLIKHWLSSVLYMGVYQRRENLRFYGFEEDPEGAEDTRQVLIDFLQSELGIDDASDIKNSREFTGLVPLTSKRPNLDRSSHVSSVIRIVKGS